MHYGVDGGVRDKRGGCMGSVTAVGLIGPDVIPVVNFGHLYSTYSKFGWAV